MVRLLGVCTVKPPIAIIMEYVQGGSLMLLLHDMAAELPWNARLIMAYEIAQGIKILHSHTPQVHMIILSIYFNLENPF